LCSGLFALVPQLLNADAEVESIQDLLGHNWISTTQRYCQVSNMKVKRDYFNAMGKISNRCAQRASSPVLDPG
jgi:site-specific recombinase XerC